MTASERDSATDGARLLEALERKLREAPSKIYRSFDHGSGYRKDGIGTGEATVLAEFFRELAVEVGDVSLLGNAEILGQVADEIAELDRLAEEEHRREMAEEYGGVPEALKRPREPREP